MTKHERNHYFWMGLLIGDIFLMFFTVIGLLVWGIQTEPNKSLLNQVKTHLIAFAHPIDLLVRFLGGKANG